MEKMVNKYKFVFLYSGCLVFSVVFWYYFMNDQVTCSEKSFTDGYITGYDILSNSFQGSFSRVLKYNKKMCLMCNYSYKNYNQSSTPRDIVISIMVMLATNIVPAVRSLRTTGCLASIVIITDDSAYESISIPTLRLLSQCGCYLINIGKFPDVSRREFWAWRYLMIDKFISTHLQYIDRILIIDLFDTIFQGDPFCSFVSKRKLYLSSEFQAIKDCYVNNKWMEDIAGESHKLMNHNDIINGGTLLGGAIQVHQMIRLFISQFNTNDLSALKADDQGYINFITYSGMLENYSIQYEIDKLGELIVSINKIVAVYRIPNNFHIGEYRLKRDRRFPPVIHQFKFNAEQLLSVVRACPRGRLKQPNYLPYLPDSLVV